MDLKNDLLRGEQVLVALDRSRLLGGKERLLATDRRVIYSNPRNLKEVASEHVSSMGIYTHIEGRWFLRAVFAAVVAFFTYAACAFLPQVAGVIDLSDVLNFLNFLGTTFLFIFALFLLVGALTIRRGLFINYSGGYIRFPIKSEDLAYAEQFIKAVRSASRVGIVDAPLRRQRAAKGSKKPDTPAQDPGPRGELPPFNPRGLDDE